VDRRRQVQAVRAGERDPEAGQRLATPADRRTGGVRAEADVELVTEELDGPAHHRRDAVGRALAGG
jgi:hypothetical protein